MNALFEQIYNKRQVQLPQEEQDEIVFWLNQFEEHQLEAKIQSLKQKLTNIQRVMWFSIYLVYKRIPFELNLYADFRKLIYRSNIP